MNKVRHVLGISGGKDSAALAIYLRNEYPDLDIEYYFADTGKELKETYEFIDGLEVYLGKPIVRLQAAQGSTADPFDHYLRLYGGYLPSSAARWCTRSLKLEPFETFVGNDPVVSYVAIRGDENREGYISKKPNIQSVFPFRQNIWSQEVIETILHRDNVASIFNLYRQIADKSKRDTMLEVIRRPMSMDFNLYRKLNALLDLDLPTFNRVVFEFLKTTHHPLGKADDFPLLDDTNVIRREDVFRLLEDAGLGLPKYYEVLEFEIEGQLGEYARSRSGCYFCFFQQRIEWVWLYEQHLDLFEQAMAYEKDGFTWSEDEPLTELIKPERIRQIKLDYLERMAQRVRTKSEYLLDILADSEGEGCNICFL